jgi:predicted ribosomally synthesized peptide with SipW-like signal peptide
MSKEIELTRRKVLGSAAVVGVASAGAGAGTFAYFSDTESTEDNTVSAGTLDLTLNSGNGFNYSFTNIAPGQSTTVSVELNNAGNVNASNVVVETSVDTGGDSANLANELQIDSLTWNGNSVSTTASTIGDLTSTNLDLDASPINGGSTATLEAEVTFNPNAGNNFQGVSVDIDHDFTLLQDSSQSV